MFKVSFEPNQVLLVLDICLIEFLEDLDFLDACSLPAKRSVREYGTEISDSNLHCLVVSNKLDSYKLLRLCI